MRGRWAAKIVKVALLVALALGVLSFTVMSLWNWLVPHLFAGMQIDFWEALGLLVLSRILFGGFRGPGGRHFGGWRHHRMHERWEQMTEEERTRLRERLRHRCGPGRAEATEPKT